MNKHIWPCQTLTNLGFGQHATFAIILQKNVVSICPGMPQGDNEFITVAIIEVLSSKIILSQIVIIDQLKHFTFRVYYIRTIAHEHINLIGRIVNTSCKALCALVLPAVVGGCR